MIRAGTLRNCQVLALEDCLTKKIHIRIPLNNGALTPAFASTKVQIYYSAELVEESKPKVIKELETIPLIISKHNFLEGAAPFAIVSEGALDLNIPFDALYAF